MPHPADLIPLREPTVRIALVAGAAGRLGEALLNAVLASARYDTVRILTRQTMASSHRCVDDWVIDAPRLDEAMLNMHAWPAIDDVFCLLDQPPMSNGRDRAFHVVPSSMLLPLAKAAAQAGAKRLILVSPLEPSKQLSRFHQFDTSEEAQQLMRLPFSSVAVIHPALQQQSRPDAGWVARFRDFYLSQFRYMLPQSLAPLTSTRVAAACLAVAGEDWQGLRVFSARDLHQRLGNPG